MIVKQTSLFSKQGVRLFCLSLGNLWVKKGGREGGREGGRREEGRERGRREGEGGRKGEGEGGGREFGNCKHAHNVILI